MASSIRQGSAAAKAQRTVDAYVKARKNELCSTVDASEFRKRPEDFTYTRDSCRRRKPSSAAAKAGGTSKAAAARDRKEVERLEHVMKVQYPYKDAKTTRVPKSERSVHHVVVSGMLGMMLLPYYRTEHPDPEERYKALRAQLELKANPRFRVLSSLLIVLKAIRADAVYKENIRLPRD